MGDSSNTTLFANGDIGKLNDTAFAERFVVFRILAVSSYVLMAIGIPGNLMAIGSVLLTKHLRTTPNILVVNLSLCDFLFLCLVVPSHAYTYLHGRWDTYLEICWFVAFAGNVLVGASILSTGAIAFNRYVAIVLSNRYSYMSRMKVVVLTLISVYVIPFLFMAPMLVGTIGTLGFDIVERQCGRIGGHTLLVAYVLVLAVLPFALMTYCYIHILLVVIASRNRVRPGNTVNTGMADSKLSRMFALVYVVYLVTTLPALVLSIVGQSGVDLAWYTDLVTFFFTWTSSAMNPIVYGLVNPKYRNAYKTLFGKLIYGTVPCKRNNDASSEIPVSLEPSLHRVE